MENREQVDFFPPFYFKKMKQWSKAVCGSKQAGRKMEPVSISNHNFESEPTNLPHAKDKGSRNRD